MIQFQRFGIYFNDIKLPVNPSELTVTSDGENNTYNMIDKGEVIIPRNTKLSTVEISSFFPRNSYTSLTVQNAWYTPEGYVRFFNALLKERIVFHFIIDRWDCDDAMFSTEFDAIITSFKITDKGGESGDIYYTLSVSEYRNTKPQVVEKISENEEEDTTYLTLNDIRDVPHDEIVVGDMVTVSGPCYETDDQESWKAAQMENYLTNVKGYVGRVLPPSMVPGLDRIFINEIGWVRRGDCLKNSVTDDGLRFDTLVGEIKNAVS